MLLDIKAIDIQQLPVKLGYVGDLLYYEGSLMSVYRDPEGNPYIYSWVEASADYNRWMVYQTTSKLLSDYIFNKLKDIELLNNPVNDIIFIVDNNASWESDRCFVISPKNLPYDYLPAHSVVFDEEDAVNLDKIIETFSINRNHSEEEPEEVFEILKEAQKRKYEIVNIHIHSKEGQVGYGRIRSSILGQILSKFAKLSISTAFNLFDEKSKRPLEERPRYRKGEKQAIKNFAEYEFVEAKAASFNIILRPFIASADLYTGETKVEQINKHLFNFFEASNDIEELKEYGKSISQDMFSAYESFLKEIKERDISLDINYGNPFKTFTLHEKFNTERAVKIIDNLEQIDFTDIEESKFKGRFKALDIIANTFKFVDLQEEKYEGKFSEQLKEGVFLFNLKDLYTVTLEIKRTKKSGKKEIKEDIVMVACVVDKSSQHK